MPRDATPERLGRDVGAATGHALADALEPILLKLTEAIATLQVEQAEVRDAILEITGRLEQLAEIVTLLERRGVVRHAGEPKS